MSVVWLLLLMAVVNVSPVCAISKEAFLKIPPDDRYKYVVVSGFPLEYAIPREEFRKLSVEVQSALMLETARERAQYAIQNLGKKYREIDLSRLYDLTYWNETRFDKERLVDYLKLCGIYYADGNHVKAVPYCSKHYLEWKKAMAGQPSLWREPNGGGDSAADGLSDIEGIFEASNMYKELEWLYADYHKTYWLHLAESQPKDGRQKFLESIEEYPYFMRAWRRVKKLAKTAKPKPLKPEVQHHDWFYSDKQEEVLKALAYYHQHKIQFMLEKALKHKDPVIAAKAREYLDSPVKETTGDETKK